MRDAHWLLPLHALPFGAQGVHTPALQKLPVAQSMSAVQPVLQSVPLAQTKLPHPTFAAALHAAAPRLPLQSLSLWVTIEYWPMLEMESEHVKSAHSVPDGAALQVPEALQPPAAQLALEAGQAASAVPSPTGAHAPAAEHEWHVPHAAPAAKVHVGFVPSQLLEHAPVTQAVRVPCGFAAAVRVVQVPWWFERSQAWHEPVHAELQQKPSVQCVEVHCASVLQALPLPTVPQLPLTHGW
jgi:hypothetical protein